MSVKKVLLKKKVSNTVYDIYTKTSSDIVVFTPAGENPTDTTVQAAIRALQGLVGDTAVATQISTAIDAVLDNAPEAFDTLKEIADWIADDSTGAAKIAADVAALQTLVGAWSVAGDSPVAATGICARIETIESNISSLGGDKAAVVVIDEASYSDANANATDLYMVELA